MNEHNILKLKKYFLKNLNYQGIPCHDTDILHAESLLNIQFNESYKTLIKNFGGCFIGIDIHGFENAPIQGKETVVDLTTWFRNSLPEASQEFYKNFLAISDDGSGNSILVTNTNDKIYIFIHDDQSLENLFDSFDQIIEEFIIET